MNDHFFELRAVTITSAAYVGDVNEREVVLYGHRMLHDGIPHSTLDEHEAVKVLVQSGDTSDKARDFGFMNAVLRSRPPSEDVWEIYVQLYVPPEVFEDTVRMAHSMMPGVTRFTLTVGHAESLDELWFDLPIVVGKTEMKSKGKSRDVRLDSVKFYQSRR